MNEDNLEAAPIESTPQPAPYKDRSAGLVVFGILTILLGCLAGLFIPLVLFGQAASAHSGHPESISMLLPVISIYGILALVLVWLGIGSIMARRWARALLLIFSWSWLLMGLWILVFMVFFIPKMLATMGTSGNAAMPPGAMGVMMTVIALIFGVIFVVMPAVWTFFYNSRHVKATCETRDPVKRWTDACPLPVLGLCLWLFLAVPSMLIMPLTGHCVMPFFGIFLTGLPAAIFCLAGAAIWGYAAWSLYKLEQRGWWLIFIAMLVYMASSIVTFSRHDMMDMYRLMDYPKDQLDEIQKSGFLQIGQMVSMMALFMLLFFGYLLYVRKFIRRSS